MNGNAILKSLWRKTSKYRFILVMSAVAVIALRMPLQTYMTLGRYQHIGIAIFLFGMGYVMQLIWSWRNYSKWARISNCATCAFFCSVGMFFYANSWLDTSIAAPTEEKMTLRSLFLAIYLFLAVVVAAIWLKWIHEDGKAVAVQISEHEQNESAKK
jgi:hypothetical protein